MGFLTRRPPRLSSDARDFIREHPEEARMAVAVALETAAAQAEAAAGRPGEEVPEQLRPFEASRAGERILGATEAAARLGVSRTTVYDWAERNTLIAWRSTKRGLNIPRGAGCRTRPGRSRVGRRGGGRRGSRTRLGVPEPGVAFRRDNGPAARMVERRTARRGVVRGGGVRRDVYVSGDRYPRSLIEPLLVEAALPESYRIIPDKHGGSPFGNERGGLAFRVPRRGLHRVVRGT